jgi:RNA polymerase subunit RPABC4/transcription elongation factor Spt4
MSRKTNAAIRAAIATIVIRRKEGMAMSVKKCPGCNGDISTRAKACPHCGARGSLTSVVALWAGRIVLICIAGIVSVLAGLSLVMRFFGGH